MRRYHQRSMRDPKFDTVVSCCMRDIAQLHAYSPMLNYTEFELTQLGTPVPVLETKAPFVIINIRTTR